MRSTGRIGTWSGGRSHGFIRPSTGGQNIFVHVSGLARGDQLPPVPGEGCSFDIVITRKGPRAVNVVFGSDHLRTT